MVRYLSSLLALLGTFAFSKSVLSNPLHNALPQHKTNGATLLGTLDAPTMGKFLTNNPLPNGYPWSKRTARNSNPYEHSPTTGVIRQYHFTIARGNIAPDGVNKSCMLINGQFPGPKIEANWGDTIQVTVENRITGPEEGTSLHWHGLLQRETPWYDGVPSVQQCPIAPGKSFTYSFKADTYGTSWYHSHYSAQYADGLAGPMIIHGPHVEKYDIDLGPIMLSDWYHDSYFSIVESQESNNPPPATQPYSDNNLINGKNNFDCSKAKPGVSCTPNSGVAKFRFQKGKTHRLRLINSGSEALMRFTIDNHEMTIIANDFVPIVPYKTNMVTLGVGQRSDVLVYANGSDTDAVWMRSDIDPICSVSHQPHALAAIYYDKANTNTAPTTIATPYDASVCGNDPLEKTVPYYPYSPLGPPAITQEIDINFHKNATGSLQWYMNNSTFRANYDHPLLLLANLGNTTYPSEWNVYNFHSAPTIRIVLRNLVYVPRGSHPMHLHGHNFWVVAEGVGEWDGTVDNINPQRRDTQLLRPGRNLTAPNSTPSTQTTTASTTKPTDITNPGASSNKTTPASTTTTTNNGINKNLQPGYLVIEFQADNPGVWPLHCHIAWHVSSGLYVNVLERPKDITSRKIPSVMAQTCRDWAAFSGTGVVDQIDSGL